LKKIYLMALFSIIILGCQSTKNIDNIYTSDSRAKQEFSRSHDWVSAWNSCKGLVALKNDGSLWQFGRTGGCDWGQIEITLPHLTKEYLYRLKAKKIGEGFNNAKIINGGYRMYAIKKDGTLWGWGEGFNTRPTKLSSSRDWVNFGIEWEGNGCCAYDIGLKEDGTLWGFSDFSNFSKKKQIPELKQISQQRNWDKITFGCCMIFGQKKDGSLWESYHNEKSNNISFKKVTKKSMLDGVISYSTLLSKIKDISSGDIRSSHVTGVDIKVRKDGTLWLLPEVAHK